MSPDGLANMRTLLADREGPPPDPFWLNVESRPLNFIDDWGAREAGEPAQQNWYRVRRRRNVRRPMARRGPSARRPDGR